MASELIYFAWRVAVSARELEIKLLTILATSARECAFCVLCSAGISVILLDGILFYIQFKFIFYWVHVVYDNIIATSWVVLTWDRAAADIHKLTSITANIDWWCQLVRYRSIDWWMGRAVLAATMEWMWGTEAGMGGDIGARTMMKWNRQRGKTTLSIIVVIV